MCRHDGLPVSAATVMRLLREEGLLLEANYQRERRQLAARLKAAFAVEPTGPNQVWQLDFTEFETTSGGMWRLAGCLAGTSPRDCVHTFDRAQAGRRGWGRAVTRRRSTGEAWRHARRCRTPPAHDDGPVAVSRPADLARG